ncbi:hypothetical protein KP509_34G037700 [Ceratopteris richardii]|uniref:Haloacid dehalogenase-like hydrolase family protein n=1 Tax=Ceratopteris richardii TaxID=49495 RepID=A0A8T2QIT3_CERRI|nr:hypothetical protein KP509_34G037700 [Ceratopteris richardii]KAH7284052.1 hypothetical protein KP509_34G037700 [Ceratopteris richardii]
MAMRSLLFQPRPPSPSHSLQSWLFNSTLHCFPYSRIRQYHLPLRSSLPHLMAAGSFSTSPSVHAPRRRDRSLLPLGGLVIKGPAGKRSKRLATTPSSSPITERLDSKGKPKKCDPEFSVPVILEDSLDETPELEKLLGQLEQDAPLAVKLAFEGLDNEVSTEMVELSLVICDDSYIQKLNKKWRGKDYPTDVLSFPQGRPPKMSSLWLLGDVIISLDTARRQAEERGHDLLDEMRILLVHGLLHVLGYDHEQGAEAAEEMEKEELRILQGLGWNSAGLITASMKEIQADRTQPSTQGNLEVEKKKGLHRSSSPFKVLLCDMDGTLLNSKSKISKSTAAALKEAVRRGIKVVIATGKTRPAVITACQSVGLVGETGVISNASPGVFVQGLLVYGQHGKVIHSQILSPDVCIKAFQYSLEERRPLLGFSGDRTVTLFEHDLIDALHTIYMEPKAEVAPSVDHILENYSIQKLLFADTVDQVSKFIRPYWSKELGDAARVVQAQSDMLEIIPVGASKGKGVSLLLQDLGVHPDEVMAIGDGENDIEMLQLVGWGVAMRNGAPATLAIADAQVGSNDEDGIAEALEKFLFT